MYNEPNSTVSKFMKQKLIEVKEKTIPCNWLFQHFFLSSR